MKFLKIGIFICLAFLSINNVDAQTKETVSKEVKEDVRSNGDWLLYVDDAYKVSKETGKPILANFTGSDWCGWCIRLKNEVFKTETFKSWANENVVLLELDYPRKKQLSDDLKAQNASLQQAFRISGYPTIWVFDLELNPDTKQFNINAIGKTGYVSGGAAAWIEESNKIIDKQ